MAQQLQPQNPSHILVYAFGAQRFLKAQRGSSLHEITMIVALAAPIGSSMLVISKAALLATCAVMASIGAALLVGFIYRVTLHPLANVPGPRLAAVSSVWLASQAKHGRLGNLGRSLHQKYGHAVRVGPNEIWFDSKEAYKAIYSAGSGFEKSDFYLATALQRPSIDIHLNVYPADTLDLLSERDMKRYRLQRKLIGPVYRPNNIVRHEAKVDGVMKKVTQKLHELNGAEVSLKEWMHIIVVECLGEAVLSWSPGLLKAGTDHGTSAHSYQAWRRKTVLGLFPLWAKLEICSKSIGRVFSMAWGITFSPPPGFRPFFPYTGKRIAKRLKMAQEKNSSSSPEDVAEDLIRLHEEKPEFLETYLRKMIMTNFGAGHETMASTLTSIVTMAGIHPDVWDKLTSEVRSRSDLGSYGGAGGSTPFLQAVIKESKRLYPVVSTGLPRRVPESGLCVHGLYVPPGTTVGCNPVALHRNEDICGLNPHLFDPERWLDGERAKDMEIFSLAWGGGARSCPGRHLAELMVWKILVALTREFDVEVDAPSVEEMPAYFLFMMTGVKARFVPRRT